MSEIYRDRTEGVAARRQELLRKRRDELVTTPHAVRRVVVGRSARIAASLAVGVAGAALLAAASAPALVAAITSALPGGVQPAVLSTLLGAAWVVGLGAWWIARARAEHRFAVAMSRYVLPGSDAEHDVERLDHEHPDEAAREMAHDLEVRSAALPVLAAAVIVPATALYAWQVIETRGWPVMSELEATLAGSSTALLAIGFAGLGGALAMTTRIARRPAVAWAAGALAVVAAGFAAAAADADAVAATWALVALTVLAGTAALVVRRLRSERELIAAQDPAAGSELFTLRGLVRRVRAAALAVTRALTLANVRRVAQTRRARIAVAASCAALATVAYTTHRAHAHTREASPRLANLAAIAQLDGVAAPGADSGYSVEVAADGRLRIDVVVSAGAPVDVPELAELAAVPPSWRARVSVELSAATPGTVSVTPFPDDVVAPAQTLVPGVQTMFETAVCGTVPQPMGLHVEASPASIAPQRVTLFVSPELAMAHCL